MLMFFEGVTAVAAFPGRRSEEIVGLYTLGECGWVEESIGILVLIVVGGTL